MKRVWKIVQLGLWSVAVIMLIMPVVVYVNIFGKEISKDHSLWAEMGSAMSGIYGPLLTILTVLLLFYQLRIQQKTHKHTFDESYLRDTKADVEFYLVRLAEVLKQPIQGNQTIRDVLHYSFQRATVEQLKGSQLQQVARDIHEKLPSLSDMWSAMYGVTAVLEWVNEPAYQREFASAKLKTEAMLSKVTCVALDNYLFCRAPEDIRLYKFQFSHGLARR
jgi:Ca2+/H+ antiporter